MCPLKEFPQLKIIQTLARRRKVQIFIVGGFVRDCLLGRPCQDLDFAVQHKALSLARSFSRTIKGAFILLDEEQGCARVAKKSGGRIWTYDFADFRGRSFRADVKKRDFTLNALGVSLHDLTPEDDLESCCLDFLQGKKDIQAKRIRMTSPQSFRDDPLRLMRAFSLRAQLDFRIERTTKAQVRKDRERIRQVSGERIREELFKILDTGFAARTLLEMDNLGLLEQVLPQVRMMHGVKQGAYHHLDVWPHSLETVQQLEGLLREWQEDDDVVTYLNQSLGGGRSRQALLKLAALLHDIGKPEAKAQRQGRTLFHGHEHVGKGIVRHMAQMLRLSSKERFALEDMVRWHLRPGYLSNFKQPSDRALFRYFRDTKAEAASIALLSWADQRSTCGPMTSEQDQIHHARICRQIIEEYFRKLKEQPFVRLVNGDDLLTHLRLSPSPLIGKMLKRLEEEQAAGKIKTKEEGLVLARELVQKLREE